MSAPAVRDLVLIPDETRAALDEVCRGVLQAWAADWLPEGSAWQAETSAVQDNPVEAASEVAGWVAHGRGDAPGAAAWAQEAPISRQRVACLLIGRSSNAAHLEDGDWALQAAGRALEDLHERMQGPCWPGEHEQPVLGPLSGIGVVRAQSLGLQWAWAPAAHPRRAPRQDMTRAASTVEPLLNSLASQPVRLQAGLGEVDILVSDLLALQPGDVIRFPTGPEAGVPVAIGSSNPPGAAVRARLGQLDGRIALSLLGGAHPAA